jgi:hypothetical protein
MKKATIGIAGVLAATAALVSSSDAHAAGDANGFGEKGELIVSADRLVPLFSYTYASITDSQNGVEQTNSRSGAGMSLLFGRNLSHAEDLSVPVNVHTIPRVAFDVTIIPRLTLGAALAFSFGLGGTDKDEIGRATPRRSDAPTMTAIGLAPRVGYILPLGDLFAFWPRAGIGIYSVSTSREIFNNNAVLTRSTTDTLFSLDLDPQFAIIPVEHFFIHAGPIVNIPISGSRSTEDSPGARTVSIDASLFHFGLSAGIGGWFNVF